jgi:hypothetical protein
MRDQNKDELDRGFAKHFFWRSQNSAGFTLTPSAKWRSGVASAKAEGGFTPPHFSIFYED